MVAHIFAGQGSQYIGMGKDLYQSFPESKEIFDSADRALGFALSRLCFEGPKEELDKTINSQPAILTVSIAAWAAFRARFGQGITGSSVSLGAGGGIRQREISYVAGLSLGEYSALVASAALTFKDAVCLVRRRGEFMEEAASQKKGAMLTILGLDLVLVKEICALTHTQTANINCPGQVVISGGEEEIARAEKLAEEKGAKRTLRLQVSGAFHSSFMQNAAVKLAKELEKITINVPSVGIVSNVTALLVTAPEGIRENLVKQVYSSVLWQDSMNYLINKGVNKFYEFGPGKVLRGLLRKIDPQVQVISIENSTDILKENNQ